MKKITFKVLSVLIASLSVLELYGQTTLINPTGEGGFENGPQFTDNGWSVVNTNVLDGARWYMGAGTLVNGAYTFAPSGSNSAYISSNGGVAWTYSVPTAASSASHLYKTVTFPAGESSNLSFKINANGQNSFDELLVYLCPTTITPLADSPNGNSPTPTWSGAGVSPILLGSFSGLTNATTVNIPIDISITGNCSSASSWKLVFTWKNDNLTNNNPPAAIDNISLVSNSSLILTTGTYTINNSMATGGLNFQSFTDAINALNRTGLCSSFNGPIVFNVSAGQTFNEQPPAIMATGSAVNTITFQKSGSGLNPVIVGNSYNTQMDAVLKVAGGDYFVFDGIDINASGSSMLDYGYYLERSALNGGGTYNAFKNFNVTMNRLNPTSCGVRFFTAGPAAAANMNSYNSILNFNIKNTAYGISIQGVNNPKDINNIIGSTNCSIVNTIGDPLVEGDITNTGIYVQQQSGISIFNTEVQNVSGNTGIAIGRLQQVNSIYNNKVHHIKSVNSAVYGKTTGIDILGTLTNVSASCTVKLYNNAIYDIISGYTGVATNQNVVNGMNCYGNIAGSIFEVHNNSVSIDGSLAPTGSSACFAADSLSVYHMTNNVFANFTENQTTPARHSGLYSLSSTKFGGAGTTSTNNDIYCQNGLGTSGFVGAGGSVNYTSISNWSSVLTPAGLETSSISTNPSFVGNNADLHSTSIALNNTGAALQSYVTNDIECAARTDNDMGAYLSTNCSGTPNTGTISGLNSVCYGDSALLSITGASNQAGISYQWASSTSNGGPYTNISNGGTYNTGQLNSTMYYTVTVSCLYSGLSSVTLQKTINVVSPVNAGVDQTVCEGTSAVLAATGSTSYVWNNGTANGSSFFPTATGIISVTGITDGCISTDDILINVLSSPVVEAGNAFTTCNGYPITLSGTGADSYVWDNSILNNTEFIANLTTNYHVTGTNANGCSNTDSILVTVLPNSPATASFITETTLFAGSTDLTYQWINCSTNTLLQGETNSLLTVTENGSYAVVVTNANGCIDTSNCLTIDYMAIDEAGNNNFSFHPNPIDNVVIINYDGQISMINIVDVQGKLVGTINDLNSGSTIDLAYLMPGVYFFNIHTENGLLNERFIKK